jgi:hypothetical protein
MFIYKIFPSAELHLALGLVTKIEAEKTYSRVKRNLPTSRAPREVQNIR